MREPQPSRRRRLIPSLIVAGASLAVFGVLFAIVEKVSAEQGTTSPTTMVTLPVGVYTQYTQRGFVPDYTGLWIGLVVAAVGALVLIAALVVARRRTPAA
ncbi:hypothetical protein [Leifsonia sp. 22587]|uniref:hypothetical protein n=1 Tax=Leifsonia sp. 22587 TaxID=3453946 RepID=UPI003F85A7D1